MIFIANTLLSRVFCHIELIFDANRAVFFQSTYEALSDLRTAFICTLDSTPVDYYSSSRGPVTRQTFEGLKWLDTTTPK